MSETSVLDFSSLQPSDYGASDTGLQDYTSFDNSGGLNAPALDAPLGTDPLTGANIPIPGGGTDPFAPTLTVVPPDASGGVNAYNDQLLPLAPVATVGPSIEPAGGTGNAGTAPSISSGNNFNTDGNLPLAPVASIGASLTKLGSEVLSGSNPNPGPMGSSIWSNITGAISSALGMSKTGTSGVLASKSSQPGGTKAAPLNNATNPIKNSSTIGIFVIVFALLGLILWSFSGSK